MRNNKFGILILGLVLILNSSCKDDEVLDLQNPNVVNADFDITNTSQLLALSTAPYASLQVVGLYQRHMYYIHDGMSDEAAGAGMETDKQQLNDYTFDPSNICIEFYWTECYNGIASCNTVIGREADILAISDALIPEIEKRYAVGEAYYMRAYYFWLLASRFGDVPLPLSLATNDEESSLPRTSRATVYQQILSDVAKAVEFLPTKADRNNLNAGYGGRATIGAANALAARMLFFDGNKYAEALPFLDAVINDPSGYTLNGVNFIDNFTIAGEYNPESIWEVNFNESFALSWDAGGFTENTFRGQEYCWGNLNQTGVLQAAFDNDVKPDPRKDVTFLTDGRWKKYSIANINGTQDCNDQGLSGINFRVLRFADVLLMKAEALNELGTGSTQEILDLMNATRIRAGMDLYGSAALNAVWPVTTQDEIRQAIRHERRIELAGEQVRLNDLLRWGIAKEMIEAARPAVNFEIGISELLPIPTSEISSNSSISNSDQNPGY